jgi:hypothetical protein
MPSFQGVGIQKLIQIMTTTESFACTLYYHSAKIITLLNLREPFQNGIDHGFIESIQDSRTIQRQNGDSASPFEP